MQPITVRYIEAEDIYQIIAGERRFGAAKSANLAEVPCWIQTPKEEDVLLHQIVENWQRADMHPFDLADALVRLRDAHGMKQREIAAHTGKSEAEISKLLALLSLDPAVQKTARDDEAGLLTKRHLYALTKLSPPTQHAVLESIVRDQMSAEDTEHLAAKTARKKTPVKKAGAPVTRRRYVTSAASVQVMFRRKHVSPVEILAALSEAAEQVRQELENASDIR